MLTLHRILTLHLQRNNISILLCRKLKSFQIHQDTTPGTCINSQGFPWGQSDSKDTVAAFVALHMVLWLLEPNSNQPIFSRVRSRSRSRIMTSPRRIFSQKPSSLRTLRCSSRWWRSPLGIPSYTSCKIQGGFCM